MRTATELLGMGVRVSASEFRTRIVRVYLAGVGRNMTVDELLLHPRIALGVCADVRTRNGWHNVKDHVILRELLNYRKQAAVRRRKERAK